MRNIRRLSYKGAMDLTFKKKRGYTLLEVMMVVALVAVVEGMSYSIYAMGMRTYAMLASKIEVQQNVRLAASFIQRRLFMAAASDVEEIDVNGLKTLRIGNECFNLKDDTLRVNLDYANPSSKPNPLAEGITHFDFVIDGRRVIVELAGGQEGEFDYFELKFGVILRR